MTTTDGGTPPAASPRPAPAVLLRAPANRVSDRAVRFWVVGAVVKWLIPVAAQVVWWILDHGDTRWHWILAVVTVVLIVANAIIEPQWRWRVHRWESTATAVFFAGFTAEKRRGLLREGRS